ncbi:MAG: WG repeat-containing protein [Pyrinomonadaceae bacterium]|nr:WG repeat-containing protein [Pyrinomonadaceae bacterium]
MKIVVWKHCLIWAFIVAMITTGSVASIQVLGQTPECSFLSFYENDKSGKMDRNGKTIIEPKFDSIIGFNGESALAKKDGLWGIINGSSEWIVKPTYEFVSDGFFDGYAYVVKDKRYYFIDRKGNKLAESFDEARYFWDGLGRIKLDDKWGYIDTQGTMVIPPQFDEAGPFSDGIARVEKNRKVFYINKLGQKVIELSENMGSGHFAEGLAFFDINGSEIFGFVNTKGEVVIEPKFREVDEFVEGRARVYIDGKYGFIDKLGKLAVSAKYDDAEDFSEGLAAVRIGERGAEFGYIDKKGREILPFKYKYAGDFNCGVAYVEIDGQWSYIDKNGNFLFKLKDLE